MISFVAKFGKKEKTNDDVVIMRRLFIAPLIQNLIKLFWNGISSCCSLVG